MEKENCLNLNMFDLTKSKEIIEIILITLITFFTPLIVPQILNLFGEQSFFATNSQYIVGTIVNMCLIWSAINIKGIKKVVGVVTLPSLSAVTSGLIFKSASIYTVYMIPFIWIGNFLLVYLYKKIFLSKKINYALSSITAIVVKVAAIFIGFTLLANVMNIIPNSGKIFEMLRINMGINQAITASIASVLSYGIIKINKINNKK